MIITNLGYLAVLNRGTCITVLQVLHEIHEFEHFKVQKFVLQILDRTSYQMQ